MDQSAEFCPVFDRPPVIETRIGVQFAPLIRFSSGHFGLFWQECFGTEDWLIRPDKALMAKETERFGSKLLRPPVEKDITLIPQVCMELAKRDGTRKVQFQADRLIYGWWTRPNGQRPHYSEVRSEFESIFAKLEAFAKKWTLGAPVVNLWDVTYVNNILPGTLWQTPLDWHNVLPSLFPASGPRVADHDWATFIGSWYFEIRPQLGRVNVQAQKVVSNQSEQTSLLLTITARGEIAKEGSPGATDWKAGLDIGHQSALRAFVDLSSKEAHKEWGMTE